MFLIPLSVLSRLIPLLALQQPPQETAFAPDRAREHRGGMRKPRVTNRRDGRGEQNRSTGSPRGNWRPQRPAPWQISPDSQRRGYWRGSACYPEETGSCLRESGWLRSASTPYQSTYGLGANYSRSLGHPFPVVGRLAFILLDTSRKVWMPKLRTQH